MLAFSIFSFPSFSKSGQVVVARDRRMEVGAARPGQQAARTLGTATRRQAQEAGGEQWRARQRAGRAGARRGCAPASAGARRHAALAGGAVGLASWRAYTAAAPPRGARSRGAAGWRARRVSGDLSGGEACSVRCGRPCGRRKRRCRRGVLACGRPKKPPLVSNAESSVSCDFGRRAEIVSYRRNDVLRFPTLSSLGTVPPQHFCLHDIVFNARKLIWF